VSWRIPTAITNRLPRTRNGTITLSGRNLILWSDFTGVDPETSGPQGNTQDEFQITPPLQTWTMRFNFGF
jgi:hypothetical protein